MRAKLVNENIGDILKPKSEEEVLNNFKKLNITDQINFLEKCKSFNISEKYLPLIEVIKQKLKSNKKFINNFGITSYGYIYGVNQFLGVEFRIWSRSNDLNEITISQYNGEKNLQVQYGRLTRSLPIIINNISELIKFINDITINTIGKILL